MSQQYEIKKMDATRLSYAKLLGVELPEGISKRAGFESIFYVLAQPGNELRLSQWFVWSVYRHLARHNSVLKLESPVCEEITEIAVNMADNEKILNSIRRYDGASLRWFGNWTAPDGMIIEGGSKRTAAFKAAADGLELYVVRNDSLLVEQSSKGGCASVFAILVLFGYAGNMIVTNFFY
ncbi:MAG: hypothetical protein V7733_10385 [Paraglaciecola polaris]|uniref:hypothetical protein n=1 Tax=Paraglaciecola polaris TaxID=222814 RepID=UPI0030034A23